MEISGEIVIRSGNNYMIDGGPKNKGSHSCLLIL